MLQFTLTANGSLNLGQAAQATVDAANAGLSGLLQRLDGTEGAFTGELQALLMQLTPEMLRQLDELLAGGMTLPQAAKGLLSGQAADDASGAFAQLLQQGGVVEETSLAVEEGQATKEGAGPLTQLIDRLSSPSPLRAEPTHTIAQPWTAGMPSLGLSAASPQFGPQLATNLLEMGVPQQVGGKGWDAAIADRVVWMVQGEQQFAKLKLNPPNLGPLEVRVSVNQDQTSVSFLAGQAAVREALEAAMPRLRELFDQQSLELVRADVADPGAQQGDRAQDADDWPGGRHSVFGEPGDAHSADSTAEAMGPVSSCLVDLFA